MDAGPNDDIDAMTTQQLSKLCKRRADGLVTRAAGGGRNDTKGANPEFKPLNVPSVRGYI